MSSVSNYEGITCGIPTENKSNKKILFEVLPKQPGHKGLRSQRKVNGRGAPAFVSAFLPEHLLILGPKQEMGIWEESHS